MTAKEARDDGIGETRGDTASGLYVLLSAGQARTAGAERPVRPGAIDGRQALRYPVSGDPAGFRLSSGPGSTMHAGFFNAWPGAETERRVRDRIRPIVECGADGTP
ncbi:hypothetical protein [Streptosporangium sp. LJ11]|uniref:hypothetical protein n=1 Tax=Streptosporangium sp. LJ11 TaxID=3436927 RepID=UPI003F7A27CC